MEIVSSLQKFIGEHNNRLSGKSLEILSDLNDVVRCSQMQLDVVTMQIAKNQEAVTLEAVTLEAVTLEAVTLEAVTLEAVTLEAVTLIDKIVNSKQCYGTDKIYHRDAMH